MVQDVGGLSDADMESKEVEGSPKYVVDKGPFVKVPPRRGITEIKHLLKKLEGKKAFICGGYARYCASPRKEPFLATDLDIYCEDLETYEELKKVFEADKLVMRHENDVSLSFKRPAKDSEYAYHLPVQLIKPLHDGKIVTEGSVETVLQNFDFTIIRCAILSDSEVMVDPNFIHDEQLGLLRLMNIHCPISSTLRCLKYAKKGYWLRPMECLKLFIDWDNRGDDYKMKLLDFLAKANEGLGLTQEEVDELEALMRID